MLDLALSLFSQGDTRRLLEMAIERLVRISGFQLGRILIVGDEGNVILASSDGRKEIRCVGFEHEFTRSIMRKVETEGRPVCFRNTHPPVTCKTISKCIPDCIFCVPLLRQDEVFGLVYLERHDNEPLSSKAELCQLIEAFSRLISVTLRTDKQLYYPSHAVEQFERILRQNYHFKAIIGRHHLVIEALQTVAKIADAEATVLIEGESGVGKELIAKALHENSVRRGQPFIALNCGGVPDNLLESELFGHVRGAFTGAVCKRAGLFRRAGRGTIFLDEVSEMSPAMQVKLLRVLQKGEFSAVGGSEVLISNARIVAATNKNLKQLVKQRKFREDLFYRLNVIDIALPPLRERRSDIPLLIHHFLEKYSSLMNQTRMRLSEEAESMLLIYEYPGNIRELENIIWRGVVLANSDLIRVQDLPKSVRESRESSAKPEIPSRLTEVKRRAGEAAERRFMIECLSATKGHISKAAKLAGVHVSNFHNLMKKRGVDANAFKQPRNPFV